MEAREVRVLRAALGLSVGQFAARLGVDAATVWRWERGKARPSPMARRLLRQLQKEEEDEGENNRCEEASCL